MATTATINDLVIAVQSLDSTISKMMSFDLHLFGILLGSSALFFTIGYGAGVITRLLNRA